MKDYHLHSGLLDHTEDNLKKIIKTASDLGFEEIAITEHLIWPLIKHPQKINKKDHDTLFPQKALIPDDGRKTVDLFDYFGRIEKYQKKFNIKILKGLEVDYFVEHEKVIKKCLSQHKIDIVLGSCHYLLYPKKHFQKNNQYLHVGHSEQLNLFIKEYGAEKLYSVYFQNILCAIRSTMFDFIAHLDFLKKGFKNYDCNKADYYIALVLKELINYDVGLEINLSGLKDVGETYPTRDVINKYKKMGGKKISIGSDAHSISRMKKMAPIIEDLSKIYKPC